jgi:hypothetical protein
MQAQETEMHAIEYAGGWLFITEKETGRDFPVRLLNTRGQCVTRGQFQDAARKFGVDRTCATFKKLAAA